MHQSLSLFFPPQASPWVKKFPEGCIRRLSVWATGSSRPLSPLARRWADRIGGPGEGGWADRIEDLDPVYLAGLFLEYVCNLRGLPGWTRLHFDGKCMP
jgi:hypothetical protein